MRLSTLALFIALPAATYAAVTTRQLACGQIGDPCSTTAPCCGGFTCLDGFCAEIGFGGLD
ncbi:hypothetical protein BJV77DRAFT_1038954 [Russula vinacea]|nr:hypothetical protein BJV77DRAFT_1038954 [Russula vinacea]